MALDLTTHLVGSENEMLDRGLQQRLQRHRRRASASRSALWFEPVESRVMLSTSTAIMDITSTGGLPDFGATAPSVSADGRFVAYQSDAFNILPEDTNSQGDIFVYDRQAGTTERVSVATDGTQGNATSISPMISADGRYVTFASAANNLVANDTNGKRDIFVHDRQTGVTERVSLASDGTQANDISELPSISADGRYVAFQSNASTLVADDSNATRDVFVYDRQTDTIQRVSVATDGTQSNNNSQFPMISSNGQWVVFASDANNLVANDSGPYTDIFVHNLQNGQTTRISTGLNGAEAAGASDYATISADGRYIAFESGANNLVASDSFLFDVFVYDTQTQQTQCITRTPEGGIPNNGSFNPSISSDGRFVAFVSSASNLISGDTNDTDDVFVYDRQTSELRRASVATDGTQANNASGAVVISGDGRLVVFRSAATNFIANDNNNRIDVFAYASDMPFPTASLDSATLNVNEDAGTATVTVNLSQAVLFDVTIDYSTSGNTAQAGSDFTGIASTLTIPAGQTSGTIQISITSDSTAELAENFFLALSGAGSAFLGADTLATITIAASDLPTVSTEAATMNVNENAGNASVVVFLSAAVSFDVTVDYATTGDSASSGSDYTATTGTLTIPAGQTSGTILIPITNDSDAELAESFTLALSNPTNSSLIGTTQTVITIPFNDATLVNFSAENKNTITFTRAENQKVTVKIKGAGTGSVMYSDTGELTRIILSNTMLSSSLTITATAGAQVAIKELHVNGTIGKITSTIAKLDGTLVVESTLKTLQLAAASGSISIGAPIFPLKDKVTFTLGVVNDLQIETDTGVAKLTAMNWQDNDLNKDVISAPWIGSIAMTARKAKGEVFALPGNLAADLELSGTGAPKGVALGSVTVAGSIVDSTWDIRGHVGSVTASFFIDSAIDMGRENNPDSLKYDLKSFTLKGAKGSLSPTFQRSRIYLTGTLASATLLRVDVTQDVADPDTDKHLGLTADRITKLSLIVPGQNSDKAYKLSKLDITADLADVKKNPSQLAAVTDQFELTLL